MKRFYNMHPFKNVAAVFMVFFALLSVGIGITLASAENDIHNIELDYMEIQDISLRDPDEFVFVEYQYTHPEPAAVTLGESDETDHTFVLQDEIAAIVDTLEFPMDSTTIKAQVLEALEGKVLVRFFNSDEDGTGCSYCQALAVMDPETWDVQLIGLNNHSEAHTFQLAVLDEYQIWKSAPEVTLLGREGRVEELSDEELQALLDNPAIDLELLESAWADTSADMEDSNVDMEDTSADVEDSSVDIEDSNVDVEDTSADMEDTSADVEDTSADVEDTSADVEDTSVEVEDTSADMEEFSRQVPPEPDDSIADNEFDFEDGYEAVHTALVLESTAAETFGMEQHGDNALAEFSVGGNGSAMLTFAAQSADSGVLRVGVNDVSVLWGVLVNDPQKRFMKMNDMSVRLEIVIQSDELDLSEIKNSKGAAEPYLNFILNRDLTLEAPAGKTVTIHSADGHMAFLLALGNGKAEYGGAVTRTLKFKNVVIDGSKNGRMGGGIVTYAAGGSQSTGLHLEGATIQNCRYTIGYHADFYKNNSASSALYAGNFNEKYSAGTDRTGHYLLGNTKLTHSKKAGGGALVHMAATIAYKPSDNIWSHYGDAKYTHTDCTFINNQSELDGGAVWTVGVATDTADGRRICYAAFDFTGCTFTGNKTTNYNGRSFNIVEDGRTVTYGTGGNGGALSLCSNETFVNWGTSGTTATLYNQYSASQKDLITSVIDSCVFRNNAAEGSGQGGGVMVYGSQMVTMRNGSGNTVFTGNTGVAGGGIYALGEDNTATGPGRIELTLDDITIGAAGDPNKANTGAGLYFGAGQLIVEGALNIQGNTATDSAGGGLAIDSDTTNIVTNGGGKATINIKDNTATTLGGGMHINSSAEVRVQGNVELNISGNTSAASGGGLSVGTNARLMDDTGSTVALSVSKNNAAGEGNTRGGGGVYLRSGAALELTEAAGSLTVQDNKATGTGSRGGGILTEAAGAALRLTGAGTYQIIGNQAAGQGGGVFATNGSAFQLGTTVAVKGNTANGGGGMGFAGTSTINGTVSGAGLEISGNTANNNGGGLFLANGAALTINTDTTSANWNFTITGNKATNGGGIALWGSNTITLARSAANGFGTKVDIHDNEASNGGGIYANTGTSSISTLSQSRLRIQKHTRTASGGGIYVNGGSLRLDNRVTGAITNGEAEDRSIEIMDNSATGNGGGAYVNAGAELLIERSGTTGTIHSGGTRISGNNARYGGGIYMANYMDNGSPVASQLTIDGNDGAGISTLITGNTAAQDGGGIYVELDRGAAGQANNYDASAYETAGQAAWFSNLSILEAVEFSGNVAKALYLPWQRTDTAPAHPFLASIHSNYTTIVASGTSNSRNPDGGTSSNNLFNNADINNRAGNWFEFVKFFTNQNGEDYILAGAEFTLYQLVCSDPTHDHSTDADITGDCWQEIARQTSDAAGGKVHFAGLIEGEEYRLVESRAPTGFITPDDVWKLTVIQAENAAVENLDSNGLAFGEDTITGSDETVVTLKNEPQSGWFEFVKMYRNEKGEELPLAGAEFDLYRLVGTSGNPGKPAAGNSSWEKVNSQPVVSGADGRVLFEDLFPGATYGLVESAVPDPETFHLPGGYWVLDVKSGEMAAATLEGSGVGFVPRYTTDSLGGETEYLALFNYETPLGWFEFTKAYKQYITQDGGSTYFYDDVAAPGAVFRLYRLECTDKEHLHDSSFDHGTVSLDQENGCWKRVEEQTSNTYGQVKFDNLIPGEEYRLTEIQAPTITGVEFDLDNVVWKLTPVPGGQARVETVSGNLDFRVDYQRIGDEYEEVTALYNYPKPGYLEFYKTYPDPQDDRDSYLLAGAEFTLYRMTCTDPDHLKVDAGVDLHSMDPLSDCWSVVGTRISTDDGTKIRFDNLFPGDRYLLVETRASERHDVRIVDPVTGAHDIPYAFKGSGWSWEVTAISEQNATLKPIGDSPEPVEEEAGNETVLTLRNEPVSGYFVFAKGFKFEEQTWGLPGAEFSLYYWVGGDAEPDPAEHPEGSSNWKLLRTATSAADGSGAVVFENLSTAVEYRLVESKAPTNYTVQGQTYNFETPKGFWRINVNPDGGPKPGDDLQTAKVHNNNSTAETLSGSLHFVNERDILVGGTIADYLSTVLRNYEGEGSFRFRKMYTTPEGIEVPLGGAVFTLYRLECTDAGHVKEADEVSSGGGVYHHGQGEDDPEHSDCWTQVDQVVSGDALDADGCNVRFEGLLPGERYLLAETQAPQDYFAPHTDLLLDFETPNAIWELTPVSGGQAAVQRIAGETELAFGGTAAAPVLLNKLPEGHLEFVKSYKRQDGTTGPLEGAEFTLYECICENPEHAHHYPAEAGGLPEDKDNPAENADCWRALGSVKSGEDGVIRFDNLTQGKAYRLIENAVFGDDDNENLLIGGLPATITKSDGIWWVQANAGENATVRTLTGAGDGSDDFEIAQEITYTREEIDGEIYYNEQAHVFLTVYNKVEQDSFPLTFRKVDGKADTNGSYAAIQDAQFQLYRCGAGHSEHTAPPATPDSCWKEIGEKVASDENGLLEFVPVIPGEYALVELWVDDPYAVPAGYWTFTVGADGEIDGIKGTWLATGFIEQEKDSDGVQYLITNYKKTNLPITGSEYILLAVSVICLLVISVMNISRQKDGSAGGYRRGGTRKPEGR